MFNIKITNRASIFERRSNKRDAARIRKFEMDQQTKQQLAQTKRRGGNDTFASAADEERVGPLEDEELGVGQVYDVVDAVIAAPTASNLAAARPRNAFWKSGHLRLLCIFHTWDSGLN